MKDLIESIPYGEGNPNPSAPLPDYEWHVINDADADSIKSILNTTLQLESENLQEIDVCLYFKGLKIHITKHKTPMWRKLYNYFQC